MRGAGLNDEHRLIYKIVENEIRIAQCRYHCEWRRAWTLFGVSTQPSNWAGAAKWDLRIAPASRFPTLSHRQRPETVGFIRTSWAVRQSDVT
jgi:Plasmid encoded toxin Txe.